MRRIILAACLSAIVAGCSEAPEESPSTVMQALRVDEGEALDALGQGVADADTRLMAYSYSMGVEYPIEHIPTALEQDAERCRAAGIALCEIVSTEVSQDDRYSYANLTLRADPEWLAEFRAEIARSAQAASGRVIYQSSSAEDLTRTIVDVETRLAAKRELRDRLAALLATEGASVADLVEAERQFAEVQGEIEAAEAQARVLRLRVETSELTVSYSERTNPGSGRGFDTFFDMSSEIVDYLALGMGTLVVSLAFAAPWLVVLIPLFWLLLRWRRRVRARKAAQAA